MDLEGGLGLLGVVEGWFGGGGEWGGVGIEGEMGGGKVGGVNGGGVVGKGVKWERGIRGRGWGVRGRVEVYENWDVGGVGSLGKKIWDVEM